MRPHQRARDSRHVALGRQLALRELSARVSIREMYVDATRIHKAKYGSKSPDCGQRVLGLYSWQRTHWSIYVWGHARAEFRWTSAKAEDLRSIGALVLQKLVGCRFGSDCFALDLEQLIRTAEAVVSRRELRG
jgi:hypothetical protein